MKGTFLEIPHIPVLLTQVKETFVDVSEGVIVDCTLGYGGHSEALLEQNPHISLIGIDRDDTALAFSQKRLARFGERVSFRKGTFADVIKTLDTSKVRGVLADIGVSSLQLDNAERGFGFESDVLDMRMDVHQSFMASDVVNGYSVRDLTRILKDYGEVRDPLRIAKLIVSQREKTPFESAKQLAAFCTKHLHRGKIHPATLVFQAIRIEVNGELEQLSGLLESLAVFKDTRVAIISFHSLEDRIVKQVFKKWTRSCVCPAYVDRCSCGNDHALGKIVTKKPLEASKEELKQNKRSRSAKLRVFDLKG